MKVTRLVCARWIVLTLCVSGLGFAQSAASQSTPAAGTLPPTIPIFPLQDVMLFPDASRPLHIFEPRYRAMVADALEGDRLIGMVLLQPGHEADYDGRPPVYATGCAGVISDVEELPDGRYNIVLRGVTKFRIVSEDQSRPYRLAHVEAIPEALGDEDRVALREQRAQFLELLSLIAPGQTPTPEELPDDVLVNGLAQFLGMAPIDRLDLLEQEGPLARADALLELLDRDALSR